MTRAAAAAALALSLFASPAFAAASRSFSVGAVVVASATITSSVRAAGDRVDVQVTKRGGYAPMVVVGDAVKRVSEAGAAQVPAAAGGQMTVTLLY